MEEQNEIIHERKDQYARRIEPEFLTWEECLENKQRINDTIV